MDYTICNVSCIWWLAGSHGVHGQITNLDVDPCPHEPCALPHGKNITLTVTFTPSRSKNGRRVRSLSRVIVKEKIVNFDISMHTLIRCWFINVDWFTMIKKIEWNLKSNMWTVFCFNIFWIYSRTCILLKRIIINILIAL